MAEPIRYEEAVAKHEPLSDYERGLVDGIYRYAWMREGVFYVGTTGRTLGEAVDRALAEARQGGSSLMERLEAGRRSDAEAVEFFAQERRRRQ